MLATDTASTVLASAVVAAAVSGLVALVTFALTGRRERKDRQRQVFGDAFATVAAYREFIFIIRRRADDSASERVRISTALSDVQHDLAKHRAVLRVEAPRVARAYESLVAETRKVAGGYISDAWHRDPPKNDRELSARDVDLAVLTPLEDDYLREVSDHLALFPAWLHRAWPWTR